MKLIGILSPEFLSPEFSKVYKINIDEAKSVVMQEYGMTYTNKNKTSSSIFIDDDKNNGALKTASTMGHEVTHVRISQGTTRDREDDKLNEEYADTMGSYSSDGMEFSSRIYNNLQLNNTVSPLPKQARSTADRKTLSVNNSKLKDKLSKADNGNGGVEYKQLTQSEKRHIRIVSKAYGDKKGISQDEAYNKLYDSAMYAIDKESRRDNAPLTKKQQEQGFISLTGETLESINEDIAYIRNTFKGKKILDVYDEGNMKTQDMFTATQTELNNPNHTPDTSIGLEDNSLIFIPSTRVATKAINTTAIATKATASKVDDVILKTGIKTDNFLRKNIHEDASAKTVDFLNGFDSKYPKPSLKKPFVNSHTVGYGTKELLKVLVN